MTHGEPSSGGSGERVCVACGVRYPQSTRFCPSDGQALREDSLPEESLVGRMIGDRYYIERQLGVGGMGVVYLAQQVLMSRRCAIKVLRAEFLNNADALGRFARGAQSAAQIVHPNVATVFDFGEVDGGESMYLAMEYVEGDSLGALLETSSYLSVSRTMVIVAQVGAALKAAHDLGIVHRDLKPENIMLVRSGTGDVVKVVDFGIARAIVDDSQRVTDSSSIIGTPAYMSPEQITGGDVDQRSDLYSLALVACEMLTGKLPLSTERTEIVMRFLQRPHTLQELRPEIRWPVELQAVLDKALSVNPSDRQVDITEFGRDFMDACRNWRPGDAADAITVLSSLGMSLSMSLPSHAIVAIATPTPRPKLMEFPQRKRSRRIAVLATGLLVAVSSVLLWKVQSTPQQPSPQGITISDPPVVASQPVTRAADSLPVTDSSTNAVTSNPAEVAEPPPARRANVTSRTSTPRPQSPLPPSESTDSARTELVSADTQKLAPVPPELPAAPAVGVIQIGSRLGAMLIIDGEAGTVVRAVQSFTVPAKEIVRLRLRLDSCRDWDTVVTVRAGQTVQLGYRNPICPPR